MSPLLRINVGKRDFKSEDIERGWLHDHVGGHGLGAKLAYEFIPPKTSPFSAGNKVFVLGGPLQGHGVPMNGRFSVVTKSPLTGLIVDSGVGGDVGIILRKMGYYGAIIEGASDEWLTIRIKADGQVAFESASEIQGQTVDRVQKRVVDRKASNTFLTIGPAGENLVRYSTLVSKNYRQAGRGGIGAVFGSKRIKLMIFEGLELPALRAHDAAALKQFADKFDLLSSPSAPYTGTATGDNPYREYGTSWLIEYANELGQLPVQNFRETHTDEGRIAEMLARFSALRSFRKGCAGCSIGCAWMLSRKMNSGTGLDTRINDDTGTDMNHSSQTSRVSSDSGPDVDVSFEEFVAQPEYETLAMLGSNLEILDAESIIDANHLCNILGLDTISSGNVIGFTAEMLKEGLIDEWQGPPLQFGDVKPILKHLRLIAERKGKIAHMMGEGVRSMADQLGPRAQALAVHVKGMELPGWDPRGKKGMGLSYAVAPIGGSHMRGWPSSYELPSTADARRTVQGLIEATDLRFAEDSLVICAFNRGIRPSPSLEDFARLLAAIEGTATTASDLTDAAHRSWIMQRLFNERETTAAPISSDILPSRLWEQVAGNGRSAGERSFADKDDFEAALQLLYDRRGLDENGRVSQSTKRNLGIA